MPDLEFPRTDGGKSNAPASDLKSEAIPLADDASIIWRKKIGIGIADALKKDSESQTLKILWFQTSIIRTKILCTFNFPRELCPV